jgi:hypothetical protein
MIIFYRSGMTFFREMKNFTGAGSFGREKWNFFLLRGTFFRIK